jgi:hypothetical protein
MIGGCLKCGCLYKLMAPVFRIGNGRCTTIQEMLAIISIVVRQGRVGGNCRNQVLLGKALSLPSNQGIDLVLNQ